MWWPCIPAHPNCACVFAVRKKLVSSVAQRAAAALAAKRAERFRAAVAAVS
jgi:hypothetical protein